MGAFKNFINSIATSNPDAAALIPGMLAGNNVRYTPAGLAVFNRGYSPPFILDAKPAVPHAKDDEFEGSVLDAKWTNPAVTANALTVTVANSWLTLEPDDVGTGAVAARFHGIYQVAPAGSFTIIAKISCNHTISDTYDGIFVGVSGGADKAHITGIGRNANAQTAWQAATTYNEGASDWSGFDGTNAADGNTGDGKLTAWYRLRWDAGAGSISADFSLNGNSWESYQGRSGMTQPTRIGIGMYSQGGTIRADHQVHCDFFRVTEP